MYDTETKRPMRVVREHVNPGFRYNLTLSEKKTHDAFNRIFIKLTIRPPRSSSMRRACTYIVTRVRRPIKKQNKNLKNKNIEDKIGERGKKKYYVRAFLLSSSGRPKREGGCEERVC